MRLQVVYTEAIESPRFFQRKASNSTQGKRSSTAWFRRLCWCQQKLILPRRNEAANGVRLVPKAPAVRIEVIITLHEGLLEGLRVWDDWLEPGRTTLRRTLSSSESLPRCT